MPPDSKGDYEVGYGKPPRETRFANGQSGNPRGRPSGAKNFKTLLIGLGTLASRPCASRARRLSSRPCCGGSITTGGEGIMPDVGGIAGAQLKSFIERIERLEEEKRALGEDIKEVYAEAKGTGFEPKIMRQILKIRKMDKDEHDEQESLLDIYKLALGMLPDADATAQAAE